MTAVATQGAGIAPVTAETLTQILVDGNLDALTPQQRLTYYGMRCEAAGLDPKSQPFMFVRLQNKLVLYATKSATQQLCNRNKISTEILGATVADGLIEYRVRAKRPDGQFADEIGVVPEARGEAGANARMKALTKAKRRAVLALSGLEVMDESELPDGAQPIQPDLASATAKVVPPYMDADKAAKLRAIVTVSKIPTAEVQRMIGEATGGRTVERAAGGLPLYSQAEYETLVAALKRWRAPVAEIAANTDPSPEDVAAIRAELEAEEAAARS